eukprot:2152356-Amphidinium_carterae.1
MDARDALRGEQLMASFVASGEMFGRRGTRSRLTEAEEVEGEEDLGHSTCIFAFGRLDHSR